MLATDQPWSTPPSPLNRIDVSRKLMDCSVFFYTFDGRKPFVNIIRNVREATKARCRTSYAAPLGALIDNANNAQYKRHPLFDEAQREIPRENGLAELLFCRYSSTWLAKLKQRLLWSRSRASDLPIYSCHSHAVMRYYFLILRASKRATDVVEFVRFSHALEYLWIFLCDDIVALLRDFFYYCAWISLDCSWMQAHGCPVKVISKFTYISYAWIDKC